MELFIGSGLLLSTVMLFQIRKVMDSVAILALQSFMLSLTAAAMWYKTGIAHLLVAAVFTLSTWPAVPMAKRVGAPEVPP